MNILDRLKSAKTKLQELTDTNNYELAIILGSGLGDIAENLDNKTIIPYSEIPSFPISTVEGHKGNMIFGKLNGLKVIALQGRFHYYEGYSMEEICFPIRLLKTLGIKRLIVSNAAGGVNMSFQTGDIMLITDHINLFPEHPLRGKNIQEFGTRFPSMANAYDKEQIKIIEGIAKDLGINLQKGVYAGMQGPSFETFAEYNMLRILGADAVGMSTVPEVITARHMNIECIGISIITNTAKSSDDMDTNHSEVQDIGNKVSYKLISILKKFASI